MQFSQKNPGFSRTALFASACLVFLLSLTPVGGIGRQTLVRNAFADEKPVIVESSAADLATIYSITEGDCTLKWIVYTSENNRGVIKHWARCPSTLAQQVPSLARILGEFLARDRNAPSFRTLFWGVLMQEQNPASREMSLRLALAAYRSPAWDVRRGKPRQGDLNSFVKDLANREPIYPELRAVFERFHRSIAITSVEKVRVMDAGKLLFYDELRKKGIQPTDKLPFDCMVWFSVSGAVP